MVYLVCYDIVCDRRRLKVAHVLEGYGLRVQKSVFECGFSERQFELVRNQIQRIMQEKEDQVRFYPMNHACQEKALVLGIQPNFTVSDSAIIL
ncbi:MAG: CRISPR-associated endonuclease Cas2 [Thermosynechococcaceae cyanobacterium MS004]|nr:CRISPR-associated endonuclease Cas2 [Thermosynechococcaceae cyanobacterium MS004]